MRPPGGAVPAGRRGFPADRDRAREGQYQRGRALERSPAGLRGYGIPRGGPGKPDDPGTPVGQRLLQAADGTAVTETMNDAQCIHERTDAYERKHERGGAVCGTV